MAKKDSILAHCIGRAVIQDAGGLDAARSRYGDKAEQLAGSKWLSFKVAARVTPRAARVASFVAMWGLALYDLDRDEISVDEYAKWANESRATAFRTAAQYRDLWPDLDVNELARHVRDHLRRNASARRKPAQLTSIVVAL